MVNDKHKQMPGQRGNQLSSSQSATIRISLSAQFHSQSSMMLMDDHGTHVSPSSAIRITILSLSLWNAQYSFCSLSQGQLFTKGMKNFIGNTQSKSRQVSVDSSGKDAGPQESFPPRRALQLGKIFKCRQQLFCTTVPR